MNQKPKFPLYLPGIKSENNKNTTIIVADLRMVKSTIAFFECNDGIVTSSIKSSYSTSDFSSFSDMINTFIKEKELTRVERISAAVPGPVVNGKCFTKNLPWNIDTDEISSETKINRVYIINDLEARAYSLANTKEDAIEILHNSADKVNGNVALLAPGNGLGEAGLFYDGKYLRPFATEGGHTEFSPRNDFEIEFYQFLNKIYGIVSWENVLSKEGMYNIYRFLRDIGRHKENPNTAEKIQNENFLDAIISGIEDNSSNLIQLTLETFLEYLARESNNLVLKLKATGGLIITGEIIDRVYDMMDKNKFYKDFILSDRMEHILKDIPIYILRNKNGILLGAAHYGIFIDE